MKTKAALMQEAMQWLKGALNCYLAGKHDGQEWIAGYVPGQKHLARESLLAARELPAPVLPG